MGDIGVIIATIGLVVATGVLAWHTYKLVLATNQAKESAEKQAQASIETNALKIFIDTGEAMFDSIYKSEAEYNFQDLSKQINSGLNYHRIIEYLCIKYINNEISKKTFKEVYRSDIINWYLNNQVIGVLQNIHKNKDKLQMKIPYELLKPILDIELESLYSKYIEQVYLEIANENNNSEERKINAKIYLEKYFHYKQDN